MSTPEHPQPSSRPDEQPPPARGASRWGREGDIFLEGSAPELTGLPRARRWKAWRYRVLWTAVASAMTLLVSLITAEILDSNAPLKRRELQAEESARADLQNEIPLLTSNVRYREWRGVWETIDSLYIVFDAPFRESDSDSLKKLDLREKSVLLHLLIDRYGGRPAVETDFSGDSRTETEFGYSNPFYLDISSQRESPVQIVDMLAEEECAKTPAKSLLYIPADGTYSVDEILFPLQDLAPARAVIPIDPATEVEGEGDPYFHHNAITVGGSEAPVTLNVNGAARKDWRCEWRIRATYNDNGAKGGEVAIDDGGEPLVAEGIPADPVQYWVMDPHKAKVVDCASDPHGSAYCYKMRH